MSMLTCTVDGCKKPHHARGLCGTHYHRVRLHGSTDSNRPSLEDRLWSRVDRGAPDECWPWVGGSLAMGYGRISARRDLGGPAVWLAHRVSYVLAHGPIQESAQIDHVCHTLDPTCPAGIKCKHRLCVNPVHLELVTQYENAIRREVRLDKTFFRCGHPRVPNNRVKNGGVTGRCGECHRLNEQKARAEGRR